MATSKILKRKAAEDTPNGVMSDKRPAKRVKGANLQRSGAVKHALLAQYYPETRTLRDYVLAKLPSSSKIRWKKIASLGVPVQGTGDGLTEQELTLGRFLDATLIGGSHNGGEFSQIDDRWEKWVSYSQRGDESYVTLSDGLAGALFSQSEVSCLIFYLWQRDFNVPY
jgi:telomerase reverse transcriptase